MTGPSSPWRWWRTSSATTCRRFEEARSYQRLIDEFKLGQAEVARLVGRDRSTVANAIRLLKLPPEVAEMVDDGRLSEGHARALLGLAERAQITRLAQAALHPDNAHRSEDAFLAARALSRADQDDNAIRRYDEVARTERGRWGDEAAYRAAWLEVHHRRTDNAVARLRAFLRDRPDASQRLRVEASWQLGWTLFTAGRFADAVSPLEQSSALATHHLERGRGRYWAALARARQGDAAGAESGWRGLIAHRPLTW